MGKRKADNEEENLKGDLHGSNKRRATLKTYIRSLNSQFFNWIAEQKDNYIDELWTDGVKEYLDHVNSVLDKFKDVWNGEAAKGDIDRPSAVDKTGAGQASPVRKVTFNLPTSAETKSDSERAGPKATTTPPATPTTATFTFGNAAAGTDTPASSPVSIFGTSMAKPESKVAFTFVDTTAAAAAAVTPAPTSSSIFGNSTAKPESKVPFTFGSTTSAAAATTPAPTSGSLFGGGAAKPESTASFAFGNTTAAAATAVSSPTATGGLFGSITSKPESVTASTFTAAPSSTAPSAVSKPASAAAEPAASSASGSTFNFGPSSSAGTFNFGPSSSAGTSSLFGTAASNAGVTSESKPNTVANGFGFPAASGSAAGELKSSDGSAPPLFSFLGSASTGAFNMPSTAAPFSFGAPLTSTVTAPTSTEGGNGANDEEEAPQTYESQVAVDESAGEVLFKSKAKLSLGSSDGGAALTWETRGVGMLLLRSTRDEARRSFISFTTEVGRVLFIANVPAQMSVILRDQNKVLFSIPWSPTAGAPPALQKVMVTLPKEKPEEFKAKVEELQKTLKG